MSRASSHRRSPVCRAAVLGKGGAMSRRRSTRTASCIDYQTTFDFAELIARIEAVRRLADARGIELRVGPLELDLIERTAKRAMAPSRRSSTCSIL
jgi:DNA-binding response OmpR family regulator